MESQLRIVGDWCEQMGMKMSMEKSSVSTMDSSTDWKIALGGEDLSIDKRESFIYLGVEFRIKGRDFLEGQYNRMLTKAGKYASAILHTTKDSPDQSLVARSLWEYVAIPAIMYGMEACALNSKILTELEKQQK